MISALLAILKFLGILLLFCLGLILVILLLVLFVPVRYKLTARRKPEEDGTPITAEVKITWLLHILNVAFSYPKAAYVRVRLFCFTAFSTKKSAEDDSDSDSSSEAKERTKKKKTGKKKWKKQKSESQENAREDETEAEISTAGGNGENPQQADSAKSMDSTKSMDSSESMSSAAEPDAVSAAPGQVPDEDDGEGAKKSVIDKFVEFFRKLFELLTNIRYTITGIYDKIKQVVNNIQYYIQIIKSDTFGRAWGVCSKQALSLLKSIGPRKVAGTLLIGTGDPASTGEVMAAYGILYPLIGDHIALTPDFEQKIVEGELLIKGKITVFKAIKTAWIIYFNKDLRRLIKLFKREAA